MSSYTCQVWWMSLKRVTFPSSQRALCEEGLCTKNRDFPKSSPPQLRRGGAKRRGGVGQANDFIDQHHPSLGLYSCFALSGSRFAASALPSSAEEGSLRILQLFVQSREEGNVSFAQNR